MSGQLPCPSSLAGAGTSGRAASRGKLSLANQRQTQQARLLADMDKLRVPNIPSRIQHGLAPWTPSSINCTNRVNQRSAKKLLLQAIAIVTEKTVSPINKLGSLKNNLVLNYWILIDRLTHCLLKESRTPMLPLGTERGLAFKMDPLTSPFI
jgi:hypothetical protein